MTDSKGRVLIIAGSDSGGGAGIQADIKTCSAFGAYAMTAITAVTAQNTLGVQAVEFMTPALVKAQIESCLSDIGADVVKIGMLGTKAIIDVVAEAVDELDAFVILDPVAVATSGDALLERDAVTALRDTLLPLADLVTPNVPEAELLTGLKITDVAAWVLALDLKREMITPNRIRNSAMKMRQSRTSFKNNTPNITEQTGTK